MKVIEDVNNLNTKIYFLIDFWLKNKINTCYNKQVTDYLKYQGLRDWVVKDTL